jgi:hypothetical protein
MSDKAMILNALASPPIKDWRRNPTDSGVSLTFQRPKETTKMNPREKKKTRFAVDRTIESPRNPFLEAKTRAEI